MNAGPERAAAIMLAVKSGEQINAIAKRFGITRMTVWRIRRANEAIASEMSGSYYTED